MALMANGRGASHGWRDTISLIAAWLGAREESRHYAVARRLAELVAEGGLAAVVHAVLGLVEGAGMFAELYADCAGTSLDIVLTEAEAALRDPDGP